MGVDRRLHLVIAEHLPADVDLQGRVRRVRPHHRPPEVLLSARLMVWTGSNSLCLIFRSAGVSSAGGPFSIYHCGRVVSSAAYSAWHSQVHTCSWRRESLSAARGRIPPAFAIRTS